jgi:hypothetical protein
MHSIEDSSIQVSVDGYTAPMDLLEVLKHSRWDADVEEDSKSLDSSETKSDVPLTFLEELVVADETFMVPNCLLVLLDIIVPYVDLALLLEIVSAEAILKLVQILNIYNSRTCQLILGAGAMHLAGLKSITAKHLALSAHSLGAVISFIPSLRNALQEKLDSKHHGALKEFDRVSKDYSDHREEVFSKLVKIMVDIIENSCTKTVKECNAKILKAKNPKTRVHLGSSDSASALSLTPSDLMIRLLKQTKQLHKVLSIMLPPRFRQDIFQRISLSFAELIEKYFSQIDLTQSTPPVAEVDEVRQFLSVQASYILNQLTSLKLSSETVYKALNRWIVS